MIQCLYIKVSHNARGLPVRSYHTLAGDELTLGRGAECRMHLPDPRVAMHHAVIRRLDDGQLHLVSLNGELEVDGAILQNVVLTHGKQVMVGPYRLTVEPAPPDVHLSVSVTLVNPMPDDYQDLKARTHEPLPGAGRFKRRLSLGMVLFILSVFLVLPLAQVLIPQLRAAVADWPIGFDKVWSPGRTSGAHRHFGSQCGECHQTPGRQIVDQVCQRCHRDTGPHLADAELQKRVFKSGLISSGSKRCAECHREHKAPTPLARQDNAPCVNCHEKLHQIVPDTRMPDIRDFANDHPGFKLTLRTGPNVQDVTRIDQSDKSHLIEHSGLLFPHSQHVGQVQGPGGMSDVRELACTSCHRPEGKEMRFAPPSFQRDCATCHADRLEVGPSGHTLTVPHGSEVNVVNTLRVQAPKQLGHDLDALKTDGCAYCHEIVAGDQHDVLPWRVMPLRFTQHWFSKATFRHASHRTQKCQSCHAVEQSESSSDIAMPDRKSCMRCHAGENPGRGRIASDCMSCHDFHHGEGMETSAS